MDADDEKDGRLEHLFVNETCDFAGADPCVVWQVSMEWSLSGRKEFEMLMSDDALYETDAGEDGFAEPRQTRPLETCWTEACELNSGHLPRALMGFLTAQKRAGHGDHEEWAD